MNFQTLFEKSPVRYLVLTPDLRIAAVTDAYLRATKTARDIVGKPVFEVFPDNPDDPRATGVANVKAHFERVLSTRAPDTMPVQKYDIRRPPEEGGGFEERHWQLAGVPIFGAAGELECILHSVEDVTDLVRMKEERSREIQATDVSLKKALHERELAQAAAEAERKNLRDFVMQSPAMLCLLRGPNHVFEITNPAYRQLVGGRTMEGKTAREALPEIEGQGFFELLDRVYATGEPFIGNELSVLLDRGKGVLERAVVNLVYQPMRGADGEIDGIAVYASEVTELVDAREREKEARSAAEESEARVRTLVDSLPELAWTARADGFIDFYNRRWFEYTGTTLEQMQGWGWKSVHDPAMVDAVISLWERSLATGAPFEMEFPLRGADGVFRWFLTRVAPLRDAKGAIVRWFGTNTNIHEQREARRNTEALLLEVSNQARAMESAVREMREAKEAAEKRLAVLEAARRSS